MPLVTLTHLPADRIQNQLERTNKTATTVIWTMTARKNTVVKAVPPISTTSFVIDDAYVYGEFSRFLKDAKAKNYDVYACLSRWSDWVEPLLTKIAQKEGYLLLNRLQSDAD